MIVVHHSELPESILVEDYGIIDVKCYGGSTVEINGERYDLTDEVKEWVEENIPGSFFDFEENFNMHFKSERDYMMFKLRWM